MSESNVDQFRIALSADFLRADGSPSYPMFDLSLLQKDERIQLEYVAPVNGEMLSEALKEFDALILLSSKFSRQSIDSEGRLSLV
ncbi:MAG: dehydrogenase, partial [bacterium]